MQLTLEAVPNPDFPTEDYRASIRIKPHTVEVTTLEEAVKIVERFIEDNNLGGGNFMEVPVTDNGKEVAWITYNCKVWATNPYTTKPSDAKEIILK